MEFPPESLTRVVLVPDAQALQKWLMVSCGKRLLWLCRSCLIFVILARPQATTPMKVASTHFGTLPKAKRGRWCSYPMQKKAINR